MRKILFFILALILLFSIFPTSTLAEGEQPPSNLKASNISSDGCNLSWTGVSWAEYYTVCVKNSDGSSYVNFNITATSTYWGSGCPGTFKIYVEAHADGLVMSTNTITVNCEGDPEPTPTKYYPPPTNLRISGQNEHIFVLDWDTVDWATWYEVHVVNGSNTLHEPIASDGRHLVTFMHEGTTKVTVTACSAEAKVDSSTLTFERDLSPDATPSPSPSPAASPSSSPAPSPSPTTTTGAHTHEYVNGVCSCGDKLYWKVKSLSGEYEVTKDSSAPVWSEPISSHGSEILRRVNKGSIVTITAEYHNHEGSIWYKLSDGGFIYSGNVKAYTPKNEPAKFSGWDIADRIEYGQRYGIRGTIESDSTIRKVVAKVINKETGKAEIDEAANPNTKTYNMLDINNRILMGNLSKGEKSFEIWVQNAYGSHKVYSKDFYVVAPIGEVGGLKSNKSIYEKTEDVKLSWNAAKNADYYILQLKKGSVTIGSEKVTGTSYTWSGSKKAMALMYGGTGKYSVTLSAHNEGGYRLGNTISFTIENTANTIGVSAIEISDSELNLYVSQKEIIWFRVLPANASNTEVKWTTDNKEIASIIRPVYDANGKKCAAVIQGFSPGKAVITATSADGSVSSKCTVYVSENVNPAKKMYTKADTLLKTINGFKITTTNIAKGEEVIVFKLNPDKSGQLYAYVEFDGKKGWVQYENLSEYFIVPITNYKIESDWGYRNVKNENYSKYHVAMDMTGNKTIKASADGKITKMKYSTGRRGNYIIIQHKNGWSTLYQHLDSFDPSLESTFREKGYADVTQGNKIGIMGNTSSETMGIHLHFEIHKDDVPQDPEGVIPALREAGIAYRNDPSHKQSNEDLWKLYLNSPGHATERPEE